MFIFQIYISVSEFNMCYLCLVCAFMIYIAFVLLLSLLNVVTNYNVSCCLIFPTTLHEFCTLKITELIALGQVWHGLSYS
jgi:hypothetical protein